MWQDAPWLRGPSLKKYWPKKKKKRSTRAGLNLDLDLDLENPLARQLE
jgi:hypothetical protein